MVTGKIVANFTLSEMACKDLYKTLILTPDMVTFAQMVQELRERVNKPFKVNSWYRTIAHNNQIGGERKSAHLVGRAIDFTLKQFDPDSIAPIWEEINERYNFQGTIIYYDNFIHIDNYGLEKGKNKFIILDWRTK